MIRLSQVRAELDEMQKPLEQLAARALKVRPEQIASVRLARKSVDARDKGDVRFVADAGRGDNANPLRSPAQGLRTRLPPQTAPAARARIAPPGHRAAGGGPGPGGAVRRADGLRAWQHLTPAGRSSAASAWTSARGTWTTFWAGGALDAGEQRAVRRGRRGRVLRRQAQFGHQGSPLPPCAGDLAIASARRRRFSAMAQARTWAPIIYPSWWCAICAGRSSRLGGDGLL